LPYTIPNEADAGTTDQAAPDKVDLDILTAGISHGVGAATYGVGPTGVQSGCAVTAQGSPDMTVAVAAGVVRIGGRKVTVASGNVTITTAHGTNKRRDLIVVDTAGVKTAIAGTAFDPTRAALPTITTGKVVLAAVTIPAADTTIGANQIIDKRVMIPRPPHEDVTWYGAVGDDSTDSSAAFQAAHDALDNVAPYMGGKIYAPIGRYRFTAGTILADVGSPTASVGGAGGPTGTFFYSVSAYNAVGETVAVNTTPTSVTLSNQIGALAWTTVPNAIGYKIYRGTAAADKFFYAYANGQATATYNDTGGGSAKGIKTPAAPALAASGAGSALSNVAYWYVITAYNNAGETQPSATATITPTAGQNVTLTITAPTNAGGITGYRIFRGTASGVDQQFYVGKTLTTTYVDDGKIADHSGRKFTTAPTGLPNLRNETGSQAHQSGIPETVNTSRVGLLISKVGVTLEGEATRASSAGGGCGVMIIPNTANMTAVCLGDGTAINQAGPTIKDITVDDWVGRGGCTGFTVAGLNFARFYNVSCRGLDVGWWFYRTPLGDDCAWNDLIGCTGGHNNRYTMRAGNSYGVKLTGGDYIGNNNTTVHVGLDLTNSFFGENVMFDQGCAIQGPPWGGGLGVAFNNLKTEDCGVSVDLDSLGSAGMGTGISISGGIATSAQANNTGIIIRSTNVINARFQSWTLISSIVNGVIDNGQDTLVAALNQSTNKGVSRDVVYNTIKLADETRTANTTLTDDGELLIYLAASTKYRISGFVFFDTVAAADFKYAFTGPASPTLVRMMRTHAVAGATPTSLAMDTALPGSTTLIGTGTTGGYIQFVSLFHNGTNAGYFRFQWAQSTSDAGNTTVRSGSSFDYATIG